MKTSLIAFVVIVGLAVLMLLFGLGEAKRRQKKAEEFDDLTERVAALEKRLGEAQARDRAQTRKLNDLTTRLNKLESKAKK
jgi:hypothetical protein